MTVRRPGEYQRQNNVSVCLKDIRCGIEDQNTIATQNACDKLGRIVHDVTHELSSTLFSNFMKGLLEQVLQMLQNTAECHRRAGMFAIDALIDVVADKNKRLLLNFAGHLSYVSKQPMTTESPDLLHAYTKTLGHLVRMGGSVMAPVVEDVSQQAVQLLTESSSSGQLLMAVLVVKSLVLNAQDHFLSPLKVLLSTQITGGIGDHSTGIDINCVAPIVVALQHKNESVRLGVRFHN